MTKRLSKLADRQRRKERGRQQAARSRQLYEQRLAFRARNSTTEIDREYQAMFR